MSIFIRMCVISQIAISIKLKKSTIVHMTVVFMYELTFGVFY